MDVESDKELRWTMTRHDQIDDQMRWQMSVEDERDAIDRAVADEPGYVSGRVDYESRCLWLLGTTAGPSSRLAAVIDDVAAKLTVRWKRVPHSRAELHSAHEALFDAIPKAVTIETVDDCSAIVVGVFDLPESGPEREALELRAGQATDIPVTLEPSQGVSLLL